MKSTLDVEGFSICGLAIWDLRMTGSGAVPAPDDAANAGVVKDVRKAVEGTE